MNLKHASDSWTDESFEDIIARSMVALYETKIDPRCAGTSRLARFTPEDMARVRKHGVIVPAPDREYLWENDGLHVDDLIKDIPQSGCISFGEDKDASNPDHMDSYCSIVYFRRVNRLPRKASMITPGTPYEILRVYPQDSGHMYGSREFVTVQPQSRRIMPCVELGTRSKAEMIVHQMSDKEANQGPRALNFGMQIVDDLRHQWRITALNEDTRVTLGAYAENVKSLLYARTLPMTPTGRKRPILHLVAAHRRRLKEGTEIDISTFLRGTREIEMDGSKFKVEAPQRLIEEYMLKTA
jgi:hypothetical protein